MSENFGNRALRRSKSARVITGVCGGIAEFLNTDANLVRLAFAVFALITSGTGILLYVLAWLLMPERDAESSIAEHLIRNFQGKHSGM